MKRTKKTNILSPEELEIKKAAEANLETFINLVAPRRWLGDVHKEVIIWWTASNACKHQMLLLPRDHMKSALLGYRVAWSITRNPSIRILYISSTSNLATKQLKFIKDILTSDVYRKYWPEMVHPDEAKREKWTEREISVDHPQRKADAIRDPTVFTAGLTTNVVGMHCDVSVLDDVVVEDNAYTVEGRNKVENQYSYLSSVEGTEAEEWVAGTRYHPLDLYAKLMELEITDYDEEGDITGKTALFDVFRDGGVPVEDTGNGYGQFLWPRQKFPDGKFFGFNAGILATKREQYLNKIQFRAQYYNDPHDVSSAPISQDYFQYYDPSYLFQRDGRWFFKGNRINVVAAVDFAFSVEKRADFTCVVIIGVDGEHNYYVLDIDRFKTDKPSDYFNRILKTFEKWGYRKIRMEVSVAQKVLVNDFKENYIRKYGLGLAVEEFRPSRWQGSKEERILSTLEPRYANRQMWHYRGGNTQLLEEELIYANPPHDDIKDALASAVDFAIPPTNSFLSTVNKPHAFNFHSRYGGVA